MYPIYKTCGYVITNKGLLDEFKPTMTSQSTQWKHWVTQLDLKTCLICRAEHGKIYAVQ